MMSKLEIYIHIPFCVRKCNYCDFLSAPTDEKTKVQYVAALKKEIEQQFQMLKDKEYVVDTVFIGGGTPSILEASAVFEILETIRKNVYVCENAEITIECNPGTISEERLITYKSSGINRISFGLQSTNNRELAMLGRIHSYEDFLQSYQMARKCGFKNINIDLMSGLPYQTIDSYEETLRKVMELKPEHISAYSLIVEEGTPLKVQVDEAEREQKSFLPSEEDEREMYYLTEKLLKEAGYEHYEISNYALKGYECKHNIGYWKRKEYLGLGLGAASLFNNQRYNNTDNLQEYLKAENFHNIKVHKEQLSVNDQMAEFMFLGLRMTEGVSKEEFQNYFQKDIYEVYGKILEKFIKQELLVDNKSRVFLTPKGIDVSNYVMSEFLLDD